MDNAGPDEHQPKQLRRGPLRRLPALLAVVGVVLLAGCGAEVEDGPAASGDIDPGPAEDVPLGGDDPTLSDDPPVPDEDDDFTASLEITAGTEEDPDVRGQAVLECDGTEGTGALWLEGDAADEACAAMAGDAVQVRAALDPARDDQLCTELYGGPDVATIVGTIDEVQVDAVLDRTDGCAIDRWDGLSFLLPEPIGA